MFGSLYQFFIYFWLGNMVWFGSKGNFINFFGIAIYLLNCVHILMRESGCLINSYWLQNFKILGMLLPFNFAINFEESLKRDMIKHLRDSLKYNKESIITNITGSMRQDMRKKEPRNMIPRFLTSPKNKLDGYLAVMVRISIM